jgi:hypothetical protein
MQQQSGVDINVFQVEPPAVGIAGEHLFQPGSLSVVELLVTQSRKQPL